MNYDYESNYNKIADFFRRTPVLYKIFKIIYKYIPYGTMVAYGCLILVCLWNSVNNRIYNEVLRVVLVPLTGVIAVSLIRKVFNTQRPYTKYNIQPLMARDKSGESFPSRHTFSIGIIAFAFLYINIPAGIVMLILTPILAASRVVAGVHFVRDVLGAMIIAVAWGLIGFYMI